MSNKVSSVSMVASIGRRRGMAAPSRCNGLLAVGAGSNGNTNSKLPPRRQVLLVYDVRFKQFYSLIFSLLKICVCVPYFWPCLCVCVCNPSRLT